MLEAEEYRERTASITVVPNFAEDKQQPTLKGHQKEPSADQLYSGIVLRKQSASRDKIQSNISITSASPSKLHQQLSDQTEGLNRVTGGAFPKWTTTELKPGMSKGSPKKQSMDDSIELQEKEELKKLIQNHSDKKSPSIPDLLAVKDSPDVVGSKEQNKFNLNPDFLFQPIDGGLIEIPMLLPPKTCKQTYTIVLDLDETLIHFDKDKKLFFVRPFTRHFLRELSKHYEIVVFTAAMKDYTDYILQRVDTDSLIAHKLYREHTTVVDNTFLKVADFQPGPEQARS